MKNTLKTCLLAAAVFGLAACETGLGNFDDAAPYSQGRTAQHEQHTMPAPAEPAPAPVTAAPACSCDCDALSARASKAENDLAMCRESKNRVSGALKDELKK